ncbi:MAG: 3-dehydroquinate synthase II [Methanothrix sp.]|uniref:3-dehydroquinate synthase II n=1 Tax=Methanothrix sp. TaxID=90426 RepID=UPI0032AED46A|nr:3-dehydroquinate synthase II [Methanothrix sp.]
MKEKWLMALAPEWDDVKPLITTALESGFDFVVVNRDHIDLVRELGSIKIACFGRERGSEDLLILDPSVPRVSQIETVEKMGRPIGGYVEIRSKDDEIFATELGKHVDHLLIVGTDWKVIPLENMIAALQGYECRIISCVRSSEEAEVALSTLEHGADGVLLDTRDPSEIKRVQAAAERLGMSRIDLKAATVVAVKPVGMGDRVCVDTCSLMRRGEGMLVGSQSRAFFLVQSEAEESPYVAARPFRVNAGAVHAYIRVGEKTRYLSELKSGDEVTIVDKDGMTRSAVVGRVKIERRPMILVEAEVDGDRVSTLLQNAETIKLVSHDGTPISVAELKPGDKVLVHMESSARHFGMSIEETIIER